MTAPTGTFAFTRILLCTGVFVGLIGPRPATGAIFGANSRASATDLILCQTLALPRPSKAQVVRRLRWWLARDGRRDRQKWSKIAQAVEDLGTDPGSELTALFRRQVPGKAAIIPVAALLVPTNGAVAVSTVYRWWRRYAQTPTIGNSIADLLASIRAGRSRLYMQSALGSPVLQRESATALDRWHYAILDTALGRSPSQKARAALIELGETNLPPERRARDALRTTAIDGEPFDRWIARTHPDIAMSWAIGGERGLYRNLSLEQRKSVVGEALQTDAPARTLLVAELEVESVLAAGAALPARTPQELAFALALDDEEPLSRLGLDAWMREGGEPRLLKAIQQFLVQFPPTPEEEEVEHEPELRAVLRSMIGVLDSAGTDAAPIDSPKLHHVWKAAASLTGSLVRDLLPSWREQNPHLWHFVPDPYLLWGLANFPIAKPLDFYRRAHVLSRLALIDWRFYPALLLFLAATGQHTSDRVDEEDTIMYLGLDTQDHGRIWGAMQSAVDLTDKLREIVESGGVWPLPEYEPSIVFRQYLKAIRTKNADWWRDVQGLSTLALWILDRDYVASRDQMRFLWDSFPNQGNRQLYSGLSLRRIGWDLTYPKVLAGIGVPRMEEGAPIPLAWHGKSGWESDVKRFRDGLELAA